jgi:hypothetical protein
MKRLAEAGDAPRSVRLIACCDEETGGLGGIEAIKLHDAALPLGDPGRFLAGSVALIPDGSPHASAGSSGLVFLDGTFREPATLEHVVALGQRLVGLHEIVRQHRSVYASPDWPDHGAPDPVITGRATVTRFDVRDVATSSGELTLVAAHAENDAPNQIAAAVTLGFVGGEARWGTFVDDLRAELPSTFRLETPARSTALATAPGVRTLQIIGQSAHGGYPHRGANPVPVVLSLLSSALARRALGRSVRGYASFSVDLRLVPEMPLESGRQEALEGLAAWSASHLPAARFDAPLARARGGYAIPVDHPAVVKLERILRPQFGEPGIFGEYGGTDASSLSGIRTPQGNPLPALVFGSMDRASHIHEAEESVDPRALRLVSEAIEQYVREP